MRHQERRDSKTFVAVDEDCGISKSPVEGYQINVESGPLAQSDPRSIYLSMSEGGKTQNYHVYDYNAATRQPSAGHHATLGSQPEYSPQHAGNQAQVPSGLPQSTGLPLVPPIQQYISPPDPTYYGDPRTRYPAYLQTTLRQTPDVISYAPIQGVHGTRVTVHLRSIFDFDVPAVTAMIMFGDKRCTSVLQKASPRGSMYEYALSAEAPPFSETGSPSSPVPLHLLLDDSAVAWESPSIEFGSFTYLDPPAYYASESPQVAPRKRKLSPQASPRRSPTKKSSSYQPIGSASQQIYLPPSVSAASPASPFKRPSVVDVSAQTRRSSTQPLQPSYSTTSSQNQQYYRQPGQATPLLHPSQSPSWRHPSQALPSATRSPSSATFAGGSQRSHLLPSPASLSNPPLVRTSTLQQSPTTPASSSMPTFNPYAIYPSNSKAILKIEGDLNSMSNDWTAAEWEAKRRVVQFERSQSGSVITATFEAITQETRTPSSTCVSCIWWEEKRECYVTSVDTIQLLEALVGVRFTVEEKNRIRRNLEGFRPATVSKAKADSEDFFKLIMGFPNPKPRNIEKDVKVFPWRILGGALKKIIGKYAGNPCAHDAYARHEPIDSLQLTPPLQSASYASTAGALHTSTAPTYAATRASDAGIDPRHAASPRSTSSSAGSHGQGYIHAPTAMTTAYAAQIAAPASGLGIGPSADLRLTVPASAPQTTSWHQTSAYHLPRSSWEYGAFYGTSPATGLPGSAQALQYSQHRLPSLTAPAALPGEARFVPLQDYEGPGHQTTAP